MDIVRQQAGHSTIGMMAHYYHASNSALQAAADALPEIGKASKRLARKWRRLWRGWRG